MSPRFSVLLPTHNRADILGYAIESVLWQTEQDFEVLIVGDGCTDNTAEIVGKFRDPRIRWFDLPKTPNFGYTNRNIALKQARGEFVAYLTDDDILFDDHLTLLEAALENTQTEWAYSQPLLVDLSGTAIVYPMNLHNPTELDAFLNHHNTIPSTCVMHRRECFDRCGYWPEEVPMAGDWRLWIRIIESGGRSNFAYCREPTCLHFVADWRSNEAPVYDQEDWPVVASQKIPAGCSDQEAFFNAITANGSEWIARLREQGRRAVDHLAWRAMTDQKEVVKQLEAVVKQLEAVYQSHSWRITAPLRAMTRLVRKD